MTASKVREVIAVYRRKFEERGIPKEKAPYDPIPAINAEYLAHCHAMLDEMEEFLEQGRIEKVFPLARLYPRMSLAMRHLYHRRDERTQPSALSRAVSFIFRENLVKLSCYGYSLVVKCAGLVQWQYATFPNFAQV